MNTTWIRRLSIVLGLTIGTGGAFGAGEEGIPAPATEPRIVQPGPPPSDAIVLFDGTDFSKWQDHEGGEVPWKLEGTAMVVTPESGPILTRSSFGDCQLHIEWATPEIVTGEGQNRGNSGVFFMGRYEVQILDSYKNTTYYHGQAGAIYKQHAPLVNASLGPGEWQTYDIVFRAPQFEGDQLVKPAILTVLHNGVLVQDHAELLGTTVHVGMPSYTPHPATLPLMLQDHLVPVRFRNIWIREL